MGTEIAQDAVGTIAIERPIVPPWVVVSGQPANVTVETAPYLAVVDEASKVLKEGHPAPRKADHMHNPDRFRLFDHFLGLACVEGQRFFAHHVQAGIERGHCHRVVLVIGGDDDKPRLPNRDV
jgi:hypothetical protein